jgi:hypothetical protein
MSMQSDRDKNRQVFSLTDLSQNDNPKTVLRAFIDKLRKEDPKFDINLTNCINNGLKGKKNDMMVSLFKMLRAAYKAGERSGES